VIENSFFEKWYFSASKHENEARGSIKKSVVYSCNVEVIE